MAAFADPQHVLDPARVAELVEDEGWEVIDVREPYEREAGHIADTRHVRFAQLSEQAETVDRERPVVFYCRSGGRSAVATQAFRASGYPAYNMAGGLLAWVEKGLPIEPEAGSVADH